MLVASDTKVAGTQALSVPDPATMGRTLSAFPDPNLSNSSVCASGNPVDGVVGPPTRGGSLATSDHGSFFGGAGVLTTQHAFTNSDAIRQAGRGAD